MKNVTIVKAAYDPKLFRPLFRILETWNIWINVVLKAAYGLPLSRSELKIYRTITGKKNPPRKPVKTLVIVAGRRSGKSFIISVKAVYQGLFFDYRPYLGPGERGVIMIVAADRQQARVIFNYVVGILHSNEFLKSCIVNETKERIELNTGVDIEIMTASFRTIRGRTIVAALCDEIAYWMADGSNPDREIINAIKPGMVTIPNSTLALLSSPYARRGALWEHYQEYWANDDAHDVLVIQAPSILLNPTLDKKYIEGELTKDPSAGRAEWLAQWREDIEDFLSLEQIHSVVTQRGTLPPNPNLHYFAFCDPSGGRSDAFTLAIGHKEDRDVVDLVRAWEPPFDPSGVVQKIKSICKAYRTSRIMGDRYGAAWVETAFRKAGLKYETSPLSKSDLYLNFESAVNAQRVELPNDERLINELRSLERRRGRSGKDVVDHPPRGRDDRANAVAGLCYLLTQPGRTARIRVIASGVSRPRVQELPQEETAEKDLVPVYDRGRLMGYERRVEEGAESVIGCIAVYQGGQLVAYERVGPQRRSSSRAVPAE